MPKKFSWKVTLKQKLCLAVFMIIYICLKLIWQKKWNYLFVNLTLSILFIRKTHSYLGLVISWCLENEIPSLIQRMILIKLVKYYLFFIIIKIAKDIRKEIECGSVFKI